MCATQASSVLHLVGKIQWNRLGFRPRMLPPTRLAGPRHPGPEHQLEPEQVL